MTAGNLRWHLTQWHTIGAPTKQLDMRVAARLRRLSLNQSDIALTEEKLPTCLFFSLSVGFICSALLLSFFHSWNFNHSEFVPSRCVRVLAVLSAVGSVKWWIGERKWEQEESERTKLWTARVCGSAGRSCPCTVSFLSPSRLAVNQ